MQQLGSKVVTLPSGVRIHGRRLADLPESWADFLLALSPGAPPPWPYRRLNWPDFRLPTDRADALDAFEEVLRRAHDGQLVEIACRGGRGRTGTALAALAVLDGMPAAQAVPWVRRSYHPRAVETPWQARWVRRIGDR